VLTHRTTKWCLLQEGVTLARSQEDQLHYRLSHLAFKYQLSFHYQISLIPLFL
jgi:hypothetical protein